LYSLLLFHVEAGRERERESNEHTGCNGRKRAGRQGREGGEDRRQQRRKEREKKRKKKKDGQHYKKETGCVCV